MNPVNLSLPFQIDSASKTSKIKLRGGHGVLILSEFTGAANSLYGAIIVNPYDPGEVIDALFEAPTMSNEERALMHRHLKAYAEEYTSEWWGKSFVNELKAC
jgi:trehalose-6-phosphate synthase